MRALPVDFRRCRSDAAPRARARARSPRSSAGEPRGRVHPRDRLPRRRGRGDRGRRRRLLGRARGQPLPPVLVLLPGQRHRGGQHAAEGADPQGQRGARASRPITPTTGRATRCGSSPTAPLRPRQLPPRLRLRARRHPASIAGWRTTTRAGAGAASSGSRRSTPALIPLAGTLYADRRGHAAVAEARLPARRTAAARTSRAGIPSTTLPQTSPRTMIRGVSAITPARGASASTSTPEYAATHCELAAAASAGRRPAGSSRRSASGSRRVAASCGVLLGLAEPRRERDRRRRAPRAASSGSAASSGVSKRPGAIVDHPDPAPARSRAAGRVSPTMPPFEAA